MGIDKKSFRIKELTIGRMPGFTTGMPPYKDFSPNINIIAGPNASGKSTTARAIQKLIWQNDTKRLQVAGHADIGGESWTIHINSDHLEVKRKGISDEFTGVPAAEEKNRYMLALHELIHDEGENLAQRIIRESIGGYDPDIAAEVLKYSSGIKPARVKEFSSYKDAEQDVRQCKDLQKKIKSDEQQLSDLFRKREEGEEAERKAELYGRVAGYLKATKKCSELQSLRQEFPEVLDKAHGEEVKRVEEIEEEINEAENAIKTAEEKLSHFTKQLKKLDIPESGVEPKDLTELENRVEVVEKLEKEIRSLETEQKGLEKKKEEAVSRIGKEVQTDAWNSLNLKDIAELDQFFEKAQRIAGEKRFAEKEIAELEKEKTSGSADKEILNRGIVTLGQWLKEIPDGGTFPSWIVIAIVILSVLSNAAGYFIPMAGLAGLLLILMISVYGLIQLRSKNRDQKSEIRIQDYKNTGLNSPNSWNPEDVQERLDELIGNVTDVRWQDRIKQKIENRSERLADYDQQIGEIEREADQMKERLSALPDLPFDDTVSYSELAWFIKAVLNWQEIHENLLAINEELNENRDLYQAELENISEIIRRYSPEEVYDSAKTSAIYKDLKNQEDQRQKAVDEIERQESEIKKQNELISRKRSDLEIIYDKLEIQFGEKDNLRGLTERLNEYREVVKNCELADREYSNLKTSMEEHSLFADESEIIDELSIEQAMERQLKFTDDAKRLDEIRDEIAAIEARVENVKSGNSLELALKDRDESVHELKQLYEDNLSSITGQILVNKLKNQMREQNRPKVFKVANQLFIRITKGRYELEINEKNQPVFMAHDTVENVWRTLDELSSGTRLQLIMAVRLAFVETQETSLKLPILADELLANSDDVRAEAIIEALTEISREGRQVFYFTAQSDEVAKWESYLSRNEMNDHKVFRLTGEKHGDWYKTAQPDWQPISLVQDIPEPASLSYSEYGEKLKVPSFNPLMDEPEQLHLWYLMDDSEILYNTLSSGIRYWGALKNYIKEGGIIQGIRKQDVKNMEEKADLLDRYLKLYRQGRPRPIDRGVLEESGATRIDEVSEAMEKCENNPKKLIQVLRDGEVKRYHSNVIDRMEEFLLEHGYLDSREPLRKELIENTLNALISNLSISREEADKFLGRLNG